MAKFSFLFFLFLLLLLPTLSQASKTTNNEPLHVSAISNALSSKGYNEMSLTLLGMTFKALLSTQQSLSTTVTVFCPTDKAFYSLNYRHDPFTLLQYQTAPSNLDKETLENSLPYGSKIDTLLHGHPQVVTKLPGDHTNTSINGVNIVDWDIYHDGHATLAVLTFGLVYLLYVYYDECREETDDYIEYV
ncbi:putative fasciclin-like arabinogalactan protein 20 [Quercus suber]|uniref:Fasciclin-like arabinogalactan protein 20 n=1 Tax=Quercus suber TaxID=58331 RepID=A0AAW0JBY2_QUESU